MNTMQKQVMAYHEKIGAPIADGPIALEEDVAQSHYEAILRAVTEWGYANDSAKRTGNFEPAYEAVLELVLLSVTLGVLSGFDLEPGFNVIMQQRMLDVGEPSDDPERLLGALIDQQIEDGQVYRMSQEIAESIRRDRPLPSLHGMSARIVGRAWMGAGAILREQKDIAGHAKWEGLR